MRKKDKKKNKKLIVYDLIIAALIIALVIVVYNIVMYYVDNAKSQNKIEDLKSLMIIEDSDSDEDGKSSENEGEKSDTLKEKFNKLYEKNNDFIGWITIEDTVVDYPVMQNMEDNEYYLHRDFNKEYDYSGLIFADNRCDIKAPSTNIILYGHHMKSGTMFAELLKYKDTSFYESHKIINFDTIYEEKKYQVFAAFYTDIGKDNFKYYDFIEASDETQYEEALNNIKSMSYYKEKFPNYNEEILTLSTCGTDEENSRFVVMAKRIND